MPCCVLHGTGTVARPQPKRKRTPGAHLVQANAGAVGGMATGRGRRGREVAGGGGERGDGARRRYVPVRRADACPEVGRYKSGWGGRGRRYQSTNPHWCSPCSPCSPRIPGCVLAASFLSPLSAGTYVCAEGLDVAVEILFVHRGAFDGRLVSARRRFSMLARRSHLALHQEESYLRGRRQAGLWAVKRCQDEVTVVSTL